GQEHPRAQREHEGGEADDREVRRAPPVPARRRPPREGPRVDRPGDERQERERIVGEDAPPRTAGPEDAQNQARGEERESEREGEAVYEGHRQDERAEDLDAVLALRPECPQHRDPHGHRYGLAEAAERRPAEPEGNTEKRHGVEDPAGDRRDGGEAMEPLLPLDQISER